MKGSRLLILIFAAGVPLMFPRAAGARPDDSAVPVSQAQTQTAFEDLEKEVWNTRLDLAASQEEIQKLRGTIAGLQEKLSLLRRESGNNPGVFQVLRQKMLLSELEPHLERMALLERERKRKKADFSQKALSLLALYNRRIEAELNPLDARVPLMEKIHRLQVLGQKRSHLLNLLDDLSGQTVPGKDRAFDDFKGVTVNDPKGRRIVLELLEERRKELLAQSGKLDAQEQEIREQLRLQKKMNDFLMGIERLNESADFPHSSLKRNDLQGVSDKNQTIKLESKLQEIQGIRAATERTRKQVDQFIQRLSPQPMKSGGKKEEAD